MYAEFYVLRSEYNLNFENLVFALQLVPLAYCKLGQSINQTTPGLFKNQKPPPTEQKAKKKKKSIPLCSSVTVQEAFNVMEF